jgi:hypothetical protein
MDQLRGNSKYSLNVGANPSESGHVPHGQSRVSKHTFAWPQVKLKQRCLKFPLIFADRRYSRTRGKKRAARYRNRAAEMAKS